MKIRLTKLKDEKFNGNHPNDINEGYVREGELIYPIESGYTIVRTNNSIYKIEYI